MERLSLYAIATGVVALVIALALYFRVKSAPEGNERMALIAKYIREGAMAFLVREYKVLAIYSAVVSALLFFAFNGKGLGVHSAVSFLSGAGLSLLAGFFVGGPVSAFVTWLWFGVVAAFLLWRWATLNRGRGEVRVGIGADPDVPAVPAEQASVHGEHD